MVTLGQFAWLFCEVSIAALMRNVRAILVHHLDGGVKALGFRPKSKPLKSLEACGRQKGENRQIPALSSCKTHYEGLSLVTLRQSRQGGAKIDELMASVLHKGKVETENSAGEKQSPLQLRSVLQMPKLARHPALPTVFLNGTPNKEFLPAGQWLFIFMNNSASRRSRRHSFWRRA